MGNTRRIQYTGTRIELPSRASVQHAKDLRSHVREALQHGERRLVIDCHAWEEFDFPMLSSLIQCAAECRAHGASFELASMSSSLQADVRALHLHDRLGIPA